MAENVKKADYRSLPVSALAGVDFIASNSEASATESVFSAVVDGITEIDIRPRVIRPLDIPPVTVSQVAILYELELTDTRQFWVRVSIVNGSANDFLIAEIPKLLEFENPFWTPGSVSVSNSGTLTMGGTEEAESTDSKFYTSNVPILVRQTGSGSLSAPDNAISSGSTRTLLVAGPLNEGETRSDSETSLLILPPSPDGSKTLSVGGFAVIADEDPGASVDFSYSASAVILGPAPVADQNFPDNLYDSWISSDGRQWFVVVRHIPDTDQDTGEFSVYQQVIYSSKSTVETPVIFDQPEGDTPAADTNDWRSAVVKYDKVIPITGSTCPVNFADNNDVNLRVSSNDYYRVDLTQLIDGVSLENALAATDGFIEAELSTAKYTENGVCGVGTITPTTVKFRGTGRGTVLGIVWMR